MHYVWNSIMLNLQINLGIIYIFDELYSKKCLEECLVPSKCLVNVSDYYV